MSVHIPDMRAAIAAGELPGAFVDKRREFRFNTLAYSTSRGATNLWTVRVRLLRGKTFAAIADSFLGQPVPPIDGYVAEISVETQQEGGKIRDVVPTYVSTGKNLGKKNATNAITQALRDALGMYNKQLKRHAVTEIIPAATADTAGDAADDAADAAVDDADDAAEEPTYEGLTDEEIAAAEEADAAAEEAAAAERKTPPASGKPAPQRAQRAFDAMPPPMLVKKIGETVKATLTKKDFTDGVTVQQKFDGIRSVGMFNPETGEFVRYSRTGTLLPRQEQIDAQMAGLKAAIPAIEPGMYGLPADASQEVLAAYGASITEPGYGFPQPYFDGELYRHGVSLNNIVGQARRAKNTGQLEYRIYDVFFPYAKAAGHDMQWRHRREYLQAFAAAMGDAPHSHVQIVPNFEGVKSLEQANALAKQFIKDGFEGAIVRKDGAGYEYGYGNYHSANLLKIKPTLDSEFPVVGYTQGTKGKDVGAVIWECQVPKPVDKKDDRFTVVPRGISLEDRKRIFRCLGQRVTNSEGKSVTRFERDIKGLPLTVEYAGLSTKTGKPLQPKAVAFRTYEGTAGTAGAAVVDPIQKLFEEC